MNTPVHTASAHCACGMVAGRIVHCEHHASADKFREALINISGGHFPGASTAALNGTLASELQAIASAALTDEREVPRACCADDGMPDPGCLICAGLGRVTAFTITREDVERVTDEEKSI